MNGAGKNKIIGLAMLTMASLIWGTAFVAQSLGMRHLEPFTFNAARFFVGGLVLVPVMARRGPAGAERAVPGAGWGAELLRAGFICGLLLCIVLSFQQVGILYTSVGKAGFITALYVVLVPVFALIFGRRAPGYMWVCIAAAMAGMYLLCINEDVSLNRGDVYIFICAAASAAHIMVVDRMGARLDGVRLSFLQFMICSALSAVLAAVFEKPALGPVISCWGPILYTGVLSCGVAYTFQILGQRSTGPAPAALILSLESVFAALTGWAVLGETLSLKEISGCALIFAAILAAQLPALLAASRRS